MTYKFAHISDVHWRSLKRHDEYRTVFTSLFKKLKSESPDIIFIGGDIVHSKTQGISPEIIDNLSWWFNSLADIAPVHVILGNHDGLILNEDRQDAITPIVEAINNKNIYLYKKSGTYATGLPGFNWCVFSCFDQKNWNKVKPVPNEINIACFHGAVTNSLTDTDWALEGEVSSDFFSGYDFGFLGDIHKKQYLDKAKRIAYPGSTIQQNYGEEVIKGFLLWEIDNRHDYKSKFVAIQNPHPFVTVDWQGNLENTIKFCEKVKKKSRFRIRTNQNITQLEIKTLYHYLKNDKLAHEIVLQNNSDFSANETDSNIIENEKCLNIRNNVERQKVLRDFFINISDEEIEKVDSVFKENLDKIPYDLSDSNGFKWSINNMKFDNTFSYGKNNYINFNNLNGVIGIFGNNRTGKSSIPGTLMYTLFNTTDRGSIKNQDIVNIRKGKCEATVNITVGTKNYNVIRETVKKTNKKNEISATTSLSLIDTTESIDESEEQRRETEKILRNLIGTSDDFLYTSFASQGHMNAFINEKSTARKSVLTKFLNLDIYEDLYKNSRENYIVLKNKLKNLKEKNWTTLKKETKEEIDNSKNRLNNNEDLLKVLRNKEIEYRLQIKSLEDNSKKHKSGYTLITAEKEKKYLQSKIELTLQNISDLNNQINSLEIKLEKISLFKKEFPIENLKEQKSKLDNLIIEIKDFKNKKTLLNNKANSKKEEIKILDDVPCGDKFLNCKFISKAHKSKSEIFDIDNKLKIIETSIYEINGAIKNLEKNEIEEKINKYNDVLNKEYKASIDLKNCAERIVDKNNELNSFKEKLLNIENIICELKSIDNIDNIDEIKKIKSELNRLQNEIYETESLQKKDQHDIFKLNHELENIVNEEINYNKIINEWKIYDLFSFSVSKKGIPAMLISSYLPKINKEIDNILSGITSFKIKILDDESSNSLNIYIDYGDSIRVIECASGMEKMMASIAIRVALINISTLPKSDIFIIDEGFGALDNSNIEACARLLSSLKKYFKTILIISHIDSIKDIVDKNLEVTIRGNDSYVEYR